MDSFFLLNKLGIVINTVGTILVFKYGFPSDIKPAITNTVLYNSIPQHDPIQEARNQKIKKLGRLGLVLLIVGNVLQML